MTQVPLKKSRLPTGQVIGIGHVRQVAFEMSGGTWSRTIAHGARVRFGHRCYVCGIRLELSRIDQAQELDLRIKPQGAAGRAGHDHPSNRGTSCTTS